MRARPSVMLPAENGTTIRHRLVRIALRECAAARGRGRNAEPMARVRTCADPRHDRSSQELWRALFIGGTIGAHRKPRAGNTSEMPHFGHRRNSGRAMPACPLLPTDCAKRTEHPPLRPNRNLRSMRTEQARPVRLEDYRPPDWLVETVDLDVSLASDRDAGARDAAAASPIRRRPRPRPLVLDGDGLDAGRRSKLDGEPLAGRRAIVADARQADHRAAAAAAVQARDRDR